MFYSSVEIKPTNSDIRDQRLMKNLKIYCKLREKQFYCLFEWQKILYNSTGLNVISLLVKYYVPLAHINKVIKLLKFKSAVFLMAQSRLRESATE